MNRMKIWSDIDYLNKLILVWIVANISFEENPKYDGGWF